MERRLESISIKYWQKYWDDGGDIRNVHSVVVTYRNIIDRIPQTIDTLVIQKNMDYSIYEEKVQKFCRLAFEES